MEITDENTLMLDLNAYKIQSIGFNELLVAAIKARCMADVGLYIDL